MTNSHQQSIAVFFVFFFVFFFFWGGGGVGGGGALFNIIKITSRAIHIQAFLNSLIRGHPLK